MLLQGGAKNRVEHNKLQEELEQLGKNKKYLTRLMSIFFAFYEKTECLLIDSNAIVRGKKLLKNYRFFTFFAGTPREHASVLSR